MSRRILKPIKNSVVCKKVSNDESVTKDGFIYTSKKEVDVYEVLDFSSDEEVNFNIGDKVMSNSTGDKIEINENETIYLFKVEHIMCKVED